MTITGEDNLVEVAMNLLELLSKCFIRWISTMLIYFLTVILYNFQKIEAYEN